MNKSDVPKNASEWSNFLSTKSLSTGSLVSKQVLKSLKEESLPYKTIASLVNRDPIFAYYIVSEANSGSEATTSSSKTLSHAISMIGVEKLKNVAKKTPFKKTKEGDLQDFYYNRAISSSLFSAYLARQFSQFKKTGQEDDMYWGALFCGVPLWYLWRFATPEMRLIRNEIRDKCKQAVEAEREILGCSVTELAQELMTNLQLPPLTKESYSPDSQLSVRQWIKVSHHVSKEGKPRKVDDKEINHILSRPGFAVALANLLAHYASHDWYSRSTLRVQKVISVYLGIDLNKAITLTHECAVEMSRAHPIPGIMVPAAKLILPPRERLSYQAQKTAPRPIVQAVQAVQEQKTNRPVVAEVPVSENNKTEQLKKANIEFSGEKLPEKSTSNKQSTPPSQQQAKRGDKEIFTEFTDIMLNNPDNFVDLHELMNAATQCISYGLGLPKVIVALVNTNETRLKTYYSVGTREHPDLSNYQADLTIPSLFSRLIGKPSSVWVKPASNKNILAAIPAEFKSACGSKEFFLMSIFVNKKPVAVFYADSGAKNETLSEYEYKQFKYLCSAATHCLQYLATKRSKNE